MTLPEFKTTFGQYIVVTFPGVAHYLVGNAMDESGMLIEHGFAPAIGKNDTVALLVREDVDPAEVATKLAEVIEELARQGKIRVPGVEPAVAC